MFDYMEKRISTLKLMKYRIARLCFHRCLKEGLSSFQGSSFSSGSSFSRSFFVFERFSVLLSRHP